MAVGLKQFFSRLSLGEGQDARQEASRTVRGYPKITDGRLYAFLETFLPFGQTTAGGQGRWSFSWATSVLVARTFYSRECVVW